ncbi:hypothetical protein [Fimbriimonas ginsengisoli]|uniref:Uncharacterized protein n=1 Tax=Fimbriimonas ginsengisoli Gsoil 348 TaxID=661478 RepID=A0A068NPG0_FIMGI|nr:hypothetical protein [Fimbriimonas ginsengisoli]AIE85336.1 hypothetical protein OP10G_1968 [Fimbriimonas ginsengisoli Gsoil 348]
MPDFDGPDIIDFELDGWDGDAEPQATASPADFLDKETGVVWLRMVPYHVERLHGPLPAVIPRGDAARLAGLPFPLRRGAPTYDLHLQGDMKEPFRDMHAYALTPFGWVAFPQLHFVHGRLKGLSMQPHALTDTLDTYARVAVWLESELGPPSVRKGRPPRCHRRISPARWQCLPAFVQWRFAWGTVSLSFDMRDYETELVVRWK